MGRMTPLEELLRPRKTIVRWTNEEWDALAELVHKRRSKTPEKPLYALATDAQKCDEWDKDRTRKCTALNQVMPLIPRLRKIDERIRDDLREQGLKITQYEQSLTHFRNAPTKEQILEQMPEEEVCRRYTALIIRHLSAEDVLAHFEANIILAGLPLDQVFAFVGKELVGGLAIMQRQLSDHIANHPTMIASKNGHSNGHNGKAAIPKKIKIAFVGFQQHMMDTLRSHVGARAEVVFIPKASRKDECQISDEYACVVVAETFTPPVQKMAVQQQIHHDKVIMHRGTLNDIVKRLDELPGLRKAKH